MDAVGIEPTTFRTHLGDCEAEIIPLDQAPCNREHSPLR